MKRLGRWVVLPTVAGLALLGSPGLAYADGSAGDARTGTPGNSPASAVSVNADVGVGFTAALNRKTNETTITSTTARGNVRDAAGRVTPAQRPVTASVRVGAPDIKPAADLGSYQCVVNTQANSNFRGYTPASGSASGNSYQLDWLFHFYSVDYARYISGYWTFQAESCFTGGGHTWNTWHQWYDGGTVTATGAGRIGQVWGNHADDAGTIKTELNFQVSAGPVQIGASTTVAKKDTYSGLIGQDPNLDPGWPTEWNANRINAFYVSPHNFKWDGSAAFQGNNGQVLWEQPEVGGDVVDIYAYMGMQALCADPVNNCSPFN